jgi:hypothetical protein
MFEPVQALILQANATPAQLLPCPRGCGLAHDIVCRTDGSLVATCCSDIRRKTLSGSRLQIGIEFQP